MVRSGEQLLRNLRRALDRMIEYSSKRTGSKRRIYEPSKIGTDLEIHERSSKLSSELFFLGCQQSSIYQLKMGVLERMAIVRTLAVRFVVK